MRKGLSSPRSPARSGTSRATCSRASHPELVSMTNERRPIWSPGRRPTGPAAEHANGPTIASAATDEWARARGPQHGGESGATGPPREIRLARTARRDRRIWRSGLTRSTYRGRRERPSNARRSRRPCRPRRRGHAVAPQVRGPSSMTAPARRLTRCRRGQPRRRGTAWASGRRWPPRRRATTGPPIADPPRQHGIRSCRSSRIDVSGAGLRTRPSPRGPPEVVLGTALRLPLGVLGFTAG